MADDCLPPLGIEDIDRKYELLAKMGEGGMGEIFRVRHTLLDEVRVIKTIRAELSSNEDLQARFLREARIATQLRHRNIAAIYDFSVGDDGTACIVMEYIDGRTLLEKVEGGHRPGLEETVEIGRQTLEALDYLHGHQVVHRDISPDNIMLTADHRGRPKVKLIDMGIAKPLDSSVIKTATSMFIGKVRYASPEQLRTGSVGLDGRSDLYSLGVVLYELLTGELAVTGTDQASMIAGHLFQPLRSFEETDPAGRVPPALRRVLLTSLAKEADDRFPDAPAFAEALGRAMEESAELGSARTQIRPAGGGRGGEGGVETGAVLETPDTLLRGTHDVRPGSDAPGGAELTAPHPAGPQAETTPGGAGLDQTRVRNGGAGGGLDPTRVRDGGAGGGLDPTRLSEGEAAGRAEEPGPTRLSPGEAAGGEGVAEGGGAAPGLDPTTLSGDMVSGEATDQPPPTRLSGQGAAGSAEAEAGAIPPTVLSGDGEGGALPPGPTRPGAAASGAGAGAAPAAPTAGPSPTAAPAVPDGTYAPPGAAPSVGRRPTLRYAAAALAVAAVAVVLWWWLAQGGLTAPEEAADPATAFGLSAAELAEVDFGNYRALVIGNDDYAHLPALQTAVRDAREVARTLEERYGFEVTLLTNVDRYELVTAVAELAGGASPGDNLLLYYAGHGDLDRRNETAYWQGVDADPFETTNWVSTKYEVSTLLDDSLARHVLVMADSCYSGALGATGPGTTTGGVVAEPNPDAPPRQRLEELLGLRARLAFTSGSLEPVIDTVDGKHSVFADALLATLSRDAPLLDVTTLYARVRDEVSREAAEQGIRQLPDLAPIPRSDHEGGNFFFVPTSAQPSG